MFSIDHLLLRVGPAHSVTCKASEIPLEKISFTFASSCLLEIASRLGMEAHVHFPLSGPSSHRCAFCHLSMSSWVRQSWCVCKTCFPGATHHLWLLQSFHLLFLAGSWVLRKGAWRHPTRDWVLQGLALCPTVFPLFLHGTFVDWVFWCSLPSPPPPKTRTYKAMLLHSSYDCAFSINIIQHVIWLQFSWS